MSDTYSKQWTVERFDTLDSTNDEARRRVLAAAPSGRTVIWADRQTKGRGRGSNVWWSDEGSLTFTLAIDPRHERIEPSQEPLMALVSASSCVRVVERLLGRAISIRWPNDIEIDGRKLAGILVERVETPTGPWLLIGIGINVSSNLDVAGTAIRTRATSLAESGLGRIRPDTRRRWRLYVLLKLLSEVAYQVDGLSNDSDPLSDFFELRDSLAGQAVRIQQGEKVIEGRGCGINPDGSLRLMTDGGLTAIYGGQVLRD